MTPFDVGWDFLVKFNHEFTGREALASMIEKQVDILCYIYDIIHRIKESPSKEGVEWTHRGKKVCWMSASWQF